MSGSVHEKNIEKVYIVLFFENKVHFYPIILVNTTHSQLSHSGWVPCTRYIPRHTTKCIKKLITGCSF